MNLSSFSWYSFYVLRSLSPSLIFQDGCFCISLLILDDAFRPGEADFCVRFCARTERTYEMGQRNAISTMKTMKCQIQTRLST